MALAPNDPKVGAAAVDGVVCWGVPKLNCNLGASEGVVVAGGAAALEDPNAKRPGAAGAGAEAAVDGTLNPNPLAVGWDVSLLANGYGGGAVDPKAKGAGADVVGAKPKEKPPVEAVEAVVAGVVVGAEPNEKIELEFAGAVDPAAVETAEADVVAIPKAVGGAVRTGAPKAGIAEVAVDVGALKVGAAGATVEGAEAPNTVEAPKLKGVDPDGLNSDNEGAEVAGAVDPAEKLNIDEEVVVAAAVVVAVAVDEGKDFVTADS